MNTLKFYETEKELPAEGKKVLFIANDNEMICGTMDEDNDFNSLNETKPPFAKEQVKKWAYAPAANDEVFMLHVAEVPVGHTALLFTDGERVFPGIYDGEDAFVCDDMKHLLSERVITGWVYYSELFSDC